MENVAETVRRPILGREKLSTASTIRNLVDKFEEHGSVVNKSRTGRPWSVRMPWNIAMIANKVNISPQKSTCRRSQELGMLDRTVQWILKKSLHVLLRDSAGPWTESSRSREKANICLMDFGSTTIGWNFLKTNSLQCRNKYIFLWVC